MCANFSLHWTGSSRFSLVSMATVLAAARGQRALRSVKMKIRTLAFGTSLLVLVGCGTLPSSYDVESKFTAHHPGCTVESVTYKIEGERKPLVPGPGEFVRDDAVFQITYRLPGDLTNRVAFRRFRAGPEGWVEQTP